MVEPIVWAFVGIGTSLGLSLTGAMLGISISSPAIAGASTERPEIGFKSLLPTIFAEAIGIYGLVVGLFAVSSVVPRLSTATNPAEIGFRIFFAGLVMGVAGIAAGIAIGMSGSALASATAERPELYARSLIPVVLSEALALYGLAMALFILI